MPAAEGAPFSGQWHLVGMSVLMHLLVFGLFVASTQVRGRVSSRAAQGAFVSFIVALYLEMYGLPLTVYLLSPLFGFSPLLFYPPPLVLRLAGGVLAFAGFMLVYLGWRAIYFAGGALVTDGVYRFVRHPQYLGLWLMTVGLWVQWPTVVALVLWPAVLYLYYRLAQAEERAVAARFPAEYQAYATQVPPFIPRRPGGAAGGSSRYSAVPGETEVKRWSTR